MGKWQLIIIWQKVNFHLKKRSSWTEIQFAKCEGFFCLDLWAAKHAKTGRRNDFREYRSRIRFLDNTQNRNSQTVSVAEIFFLYRNGMVLVATQQREDFHFLQTGLSLLSLL